LNLTSGEHTICVRAYDKAGNVAIKKLIIKVAYSVTKEETTAMTVGYGRGISIPSGLLYVICIGVVVLVVVRYVFMVRFEARFIKAEE